MTGSVVPCDAECSILACKGAQEGKFDYIAHISSILIPHTVLALSPRNNGKIAQATTATQRPDAYHFCAALPRDGGRRCDMLGLRAARHRSRPMVPVLRGGEIRAVAFRCERFFPLFGP